MNTKEIRELIRKENPSAKAADVEMYSHQFQTYFEAAENIQQNGVVVSHPRTGQPMENPYVKMRATSQACMQKMRMLKVDKLWTLAADKIDAHAKTP